jgi:hypothetical protein
MFQQGHKIGKGRSCALSGKCTFHTWEEQVTSMLTLELPNVFEEEQGNLYGWYQEKERETSGEETKRCEGDKLCKI